MPRWEDEGLLLGLKPYGEFHALAHVFCHHHGHAKGLLYGRHRNPLPAGTAVHCRWQAKLPEQLGTLTLEASPGAAVMAVLPSPAMACVGAWSRLLVDSLPEGTAYGALFMRSRYLLSVLPHSGALQAGAEYAWWESRFLRDIGYGLDTASCALTGVKEGLAYVSPSTGRAVTAEAAQPYIGKLLPLPAFIVRPLPPTDLLLTQQEVEAGLHLTGSFLRRQVYEPLDKPLPPARLRLEAGFFQASA